MSENITPALLQTFCSVERYRVAIQKPWTRGEWTYATCGRIIVRVSALSQINDDMEAPNLTSFDFTMIEPFHLLDASQIPPQSAETKECPTCNGRGTEHDCPDCECECEECDGVGKVSIVSDWKTSLTMSGALFWLGLVRRLATLPNVRVPDKTTRNPTPFIFDGGDGLIMGLRARYDRHLEVFL